MKRTIQLLLVELFHSNPGASDEEIRDAVMAEFPNSVYGQRHHDRAQKDRRRYNTADFKCMADNLPAIRAYNPARHPELAKQQTLGL